MLRRSFQKYSKTQEQKMPVGSSEASSKIKHLKKELDLQMCYHRLWTNKDFQQLLEALRQENKWLNPQEFKDNDEFMRAYNVMWARAQSIKEMVLLLSTAEQRVKDIGNRIKKMEIKNAVK